MGGTWHFQANLIAPWTEVSEPFWKTGGSEEYIFEPEQSTASSHLPSNLLTSQASKSPLHNRPHIFHQWHILIQSHEKTIPPNQPRRISNDMGPPCRIRDDVCPFSAGFLPSRTRGPRVALPFHRELLGFSFEKNSPGGSTGGFNRQASPSMPAGGANGTVAGGNLHRVVIFAFLAKLHAYAGWSAVYIPSPW